MKVGWVQYDTLFCQALADHRIKVKLSSGWRVPNIEDRAKVFDSQPGRVIVLNDNLHPEYATTLDAGYRFWWPVRRVWGGRFSLTANAYVTRYWNATLLETTTRNGQDSLLFDGELSAVQQLTNAQTAWL